MIEGIPLPPMEFAYLVGSLTYEEFQAAGKGVTELIKAHGLIYPGARFLDVGCGCGRVARELLKGYKSLQSYTGFDRHKPMVRWAQANITPVIPNFKFELLCCQKYLLRLG